MTYKTITLEYTDSGLTVWKHTERNTEKVRIYSGDYVIPQHIAELHFNHAVFKVIDKRTTV